jgi:hypothetical protein
MDSETLRALRHIATVTNPTTFWTLRTPRTLIAPLVAAGYVIENPIARDWYRLTAAGADAYRALQTNESEDTR